MVWQQASTPAASNPRAKQTRAERELEKSRHLEQICKELHINWTGDRLSALQTSKAAPLKREVADPFLTSVIVVIQRLGRTVPPNGFATGGKRGKDVACSACYEELRRCVGPWGHRLVELGVLKNGTCSYPSFLESSTG